jgi:tRNA(Ile)-lysidine synthase
MLTNVLAFATRRPNWPALNIGRATASATPPLEFHSLARFAKRKPFNNTSFSETIMSAGESHSFETDFEAAWPSSQWSESHVLLAISGGADSVAMLRAAVAVKKRAGGAGRLLAAHLNHGLRGDESDSDAEWVRQLCGRLHVPLECEKRNVAQTAQQQGDGWEAAARTVRYEFLQTTAERLGARYVAVAHTADDQIETVLHRILRGTGIRGLGGMPFARSLAPSVALVRPLLKIRRQQVLSYLGDVGQDFRDDASNIDLRFTRNRLRHELLPLLRAGYNSDIDETLLRLAAQAEEAHRLVSAFAEELVGERVKLELTSPGDADDRLRASELRIDCRGLSEQPAVVVRELLRHAWDTAGWPQQNMGFDEWQLLASMAAGNEDPRPITLPGSFRASRHGDMLAIEALSLA